MWKKIYLFLCNSYNFTLFCKCTLAPCCSNTLTTSTCPLYDAIIRGVHLSYPNINICHSHVLTFTGKNIHEYGLPTGLKVSVFASCTHCMQIPRKSVVVYTMKSLSKYMVSLTQTCVVLKRTYTVCVCVVSAQSRSVLMPVIAISVSLNTKMCSPTKSSRWGNHPLVPIQQLQLHLVL